MSLDLSIEQHRNALRTACETLLLPGMPADAAADLAWRADAASPAQLAFLALALPEQSAELLRALVASTGLTVYPSDEDPGDSIRFPCMHIDPDGDVIVWQGWTRYVPHADIGGSFSMRDVPALVLALFDAKDRDGSIAACEEHSR